MTVLYLHGFASSPESYKGRAFDAYLAERGIALVRLDLRLPDRDRLRVSAMIEHTLEQAEVHDARAIIGSSLGGLVASHVASQRKLDAAILMAPAFRFAQRWAERLGPEGMRSWEQRPIEVPDHAGGPPLRVDHGFYLDASQVDASFPTLRCPCLVFHGRLDDTVPFVGSQQFVEHANGSPHSTELVELDDGHPLAASLDTMLPRAHQFLSQHLTTS